MDKAVLVKVIDLLDSNNGRDKVCKLVQYTGKLALCLNAPYFEKRCLTVTKQLSATRRILRLFRFLNLKENVLDALAERNTKRRYLLLAGAIVGVLGEFTDDICWAADMDLVPSWIKKYESWADYLWALELVLAMPVKSANVREALQQVQLASKAQDLTEMHNAKVKLLSKMLSQIKLVADFLHATRLAANWPTNCKSQDAMCGMLSSAISLYILWKPQALRKIKNL